MKRSNSPLDQHNQHHVYEPPSHGPQQPLLFNPDWRIPDAAQLAYPLENSFAQQYDNGYSVPYQISPTDFMSPQQPQMNHGLQMDYFPVGSQMDSMSFDLHEFQTDTMFQTANGLPEMNMAPQNLPGGSPTDTWLEVRSPTSSGSDNGWATIEYPQHSLEASQEPQVAPAIFNPGQTLHGQTLGQTFHNRTLSDSSYSDLELQSRHSWSSGYGDISNAISSPGTDSLGDVDLHHDHFNARDHSQHEEVRTNRPSAPALVTSSVSKPINIKKSSSPPQRSPTSIGKCSPTRRQSRKTTSTKATKGVARRPSQPAKLDTEKRIGRRKGPLRPEQRKQAGEIRKLGACLRCKFLKKTCDTAQCDSGEKCRGCKPSHARLWVVPCTRIDIKELAYFMKDWRADYERHVSLAFSIGNVKGVGDTERILYITHGYGPVLPVKAREVFVRDERCFGVEWVESLHSPPREHTVNTAKLSAGIEGIEPALLSDYIDKHIDDGFEDFVDDYFEGTPFLTEMLKTVYRYWLLERTPVLRKCLQLLVSYNLTQHVTMVVGVPDEEGFLGKIRDPTSKFRGQTVAPVMINFQIKCGLAHMWRELQKEILEELSVLYSSVYTKDKLKHWPTIFMTATILLGVWEEMQFDCQYRIPDQEVVSKFCDDMESTPVGVIVGLFSAISQKLPSLREWDTEKHHTQLQSNYAVCTALTEVRQHVNRYDGYLRTRPTATFDRDDFDSLSSKFVSKLVIRPN